MNNPEQQAGPQLTRRQLREQRNTGATPLVPDSLPDEPPAVPVAPLPHAAAPVVVPDPPVADESVDVQAVPMTRRQAREQERIRTASVPVITPEGDAQPEQAVSPEPDAAPRGRFWGFGSTRTKAAPSTAESAPPVAETATAVDVAVDAETTAVAPVAEAVPVEKAARVDHAPLLPTVPEPELLHDENSLAALIAPEQDEEPGSRVVNPQLGSSLLAGAKLKDEAPSSFDRLLTRPDASGSTTAPSALILPDAASSATLVAPVAETGDLLVTGTFDLPQGLGSTGHAEGTADGKDVDAVLMDGEIPAHSSPTPIAASAAVSTIKPAGEVIKPPAPEKGSRLMLMLAITAGVLAVALVGLLIVAIVLGAF